MNLIINLLVTAVVAFFLGKNLNGVHITTFTTAIIFAIVLGILNAFIKPVLSFFSFPLTVLTFGLFALVINAVIILLCGWLVSGFKVDGFWWAMLFSIILSIITSFFNSILGIGD
ncbi:phage holin family protein [Weeksellaceae bacterium TAE3-ERU29]|nr:phage holin family protein [Weeksellaceae bacterium TAE3-ERU29]